MVSGMVSAAWCQQLAGQRGQGAGGMPAWRGGTLNQCYGFLTYLGVRPWPHFLVRGLACSEVPAGTTQQ